MRGYSQSAPQLNVPSFGDDEFRFSSCVSLACRQQETGLDIDQSAVRVQTPLGLRSFAVRIVPNANVVRYVSDHDPLWISKKGDSAILEQPLDMPRIGLALLVLSPEVYCVPILLLASVEIKAQRCVNATPEKCAIGHPALGSGKRRLG